jgi:hypothetical protein
MAKISILGRSIPENTKRLVRDAALFYAKELMSTRLVNTLNIRVEIRRTTLKKNEYGVAYRDVQGSYSQKDHRIVLLYRETSSMLITLAHEMVHVKQFTKNELQHRRWKSDGKLHTRWKGIDMGIADSIEYSKRAWEVEAKALQTELFKKFVKILGSVIDKG